MISLRIWANDPLVSFLVELQHDKCDPSIWIQRLCQHGYTIDWATMAHFCPWPVVRIAAVCVPGQIKDSREAAVLDWLDSNLARLDYSIVYQALSLSGFTHVSTRMDRNEPLSGVGGIIFRNESDLALFILAMGDWVTTDQELSARRQRGIQTIQAV